MKTNLDVLREMEKDILVYLLYTIYNAKDDGTTSIFGSLESINEWLDFVVEDESENTTEEQVEG